MGCPKHLIEFDGRTALDRIISVAHECVDQVILSISSETKVPASCLQAAEPVILVPDSVSGQGPLQGLADSISLLDASVIRAAVVACDYPLISPELLRLLFIALGSFDAAVPLVRGHLHVLLSAIRAEAFRGDSNLLTASSVRGAFQARRTAVLTEQTLLRFGIDPVQLETANTPSELKYVKSAAARFSRS